MQLRFAILLCCLILISGWKLFAQQPVKPGLLEVNAQYRPRFEIRSGAFRPLSEGEPPAALVSNRFRLGLNYGYLDQLQVKLSLQEVSIWGQNDAS